jgi:two-component system sensor histidine kinase/response regulator
MIHAAAPVASLDIDVLVVDDVEENRVAMQALLTRPGVRVLTAGSGPEALELLLQHDVALALLDVQMPGMDGFELAELMRGTERTRPVPIIFVTAMPRDAMRPFRGYEAGAVDFLHKPVDPMVIESKVGVFVEIYEQRRVLAQRNAALQHAIDLNAAMVAVLTHDLRAPLSAVTVSAEVADRLAPREDPRLAKAIGHIRSSSRRMATMIAQLLDFSHIRSGALQLERRFVSLGAVCQAAADELRAGRPEARFEIGHEGDLDGWFDADRLAQVFSNLLGNAVEHGRDEPVHVHLDGRDRRWVRFEVSNTGELPDEVKARLFMPFRGRSETSREGLGLGLYIVEQLVLAHGGEVSGDGGDGRTRFEVRLPRGRGAAG